MSDLSNVKVGDYVMWGNRWSSYLSRAKVEKITPSGRLRVDGKLFDNHGWQRGGDTWNKIYIEPFDQTRWDEFIELQRVDKLRKELAEIHWKIIPAYVVEAVHKLALSPVEKGE